MPRKLTVQNKLRVLRAIHRISQTDLAKELDMTRQAIANIENYVTASMSFDLMADLMTFFELESFDELFELVEVEEETGNRVATEEAA